MMGIAALSAILRTSAPFAFLMSAKPDRSTAMRQIIDQVREAFPFDAPDAYICGTTCHGCPKKLLEIVESEIIHWEYALENGDQPTFDEIDRFAKLCRNVRRGLVRNGILEKS